MGQAMRVLSPSASPLNFFGAEVRRLRVDRGLSLEALAREVFTSKDLVRKIETAERHPTWEFADRCDTVLGCQGYLRRMWPMLARERSLQLGQSGVTTDAPFRSDLYDRPVLDWIISAGQPPSPRDEHTTEHRFGDELAKLRQLDHEHGAGDYYPVVVGSLPAVGGMSRRAAIGYQELAGYEAVDLGADGVAQRHYLGALRTAVAAGDRLYGGYLIAVSMAHLALHCGDPEQAARLAVAAMQGTAGLSTAATRSASLMVLARARARQGDKTGAVAAVTAADRELEHSRPEDEPSFISYFGEADLADERAHTFFDLGMLAEAQQQARTALDRIAPSRVRRQAIDNALLASTLARSNELEEACSVGKRAVDYTAATASFRSVHRIMTMLGHLQQHAGLPIVRDLFEYTHHKLPALTPTLDPLPR